MPYLPAPICFNSTLKAGDIMLNIFYGNMPEAVYDTSMYFKNTYKDRWITSDLSREMIKNVDKSEVIDANAINSSIFGIMSPTGLSGGVKTLILINYDSSHVFNASNCGDNCAKWLLKIAENKKVVINLRHLMDFGDGEFKIRVLNTGRIVKNMEELVHEAAEFV